MNLISLIYYLRIFSDLFGNISVIIGGIVILIFLYALFEKKIIIGNISKQPLLLLFIINFLISFLWSFITLYNFDDIIFRKALYYSIKYLSLIAMYLMVKNEFILKHKNINKLLNNINILFCIFALIGIYQVLFTGLDRASWPLYHSNSLGLLFVFCLIFTLNFYRGRKKYIIFIILLAGILSTKSISAIFIFFIAFLILFYKKEENFSKIVILSILILLIFSVGDYFLSERFFSLKFDMNRYYKLWNWDNNLTPNNSFEWRIINWGGLFRTFQKNLLFGYGTLSFLIVNPLKSTPGKYGGFNPHSEIIGWLVQYGLVGSILFIYISLRLIIFSLKKLKFDVKREFYILFASLLISSLIGKGILQMQFYYLLILLFFRDSKIYQINKY